MSIFSAGNAPIVNQRVQQAAQPARDAQRAKAKPSVLPRPTDEADIQVQNSASEGAVRSLTGNADQETADDREQQDHYRPPGGNEAMPKSKRPKLDLRG